MTLSGAGRGGGGRRGFRRPLRRRIERFNRLVFSRFLYPKSGKINSRGARSCNANLHRDAFFKKIAPPNSQPAAFPVISRLLKFPASPLPSTFGERTSTPTPPPGGGTLNLKYVPEPATRWIYFLEWWSSRLSTYILLPRSLTTPRRIFNLTGEEKNVERLLFSIRRKLLLEKIGRESKRVKTRIYLLILNKSLLIYFFKYYYTVW